MVIIVISTPSNVLQESLYDQVIGTSVLDHNFIC